MSPVLHCFHQWNSVLLLCFPFSPGAATLPNGPTDMRSAVMITSRDFLLVSLNDGRPSDQINNQPTVAAQVTIFISYFLFDLGERFQPATQGHFPSHLVSPSSSSFSLRQNVWTNSTFLEVVFFRSCIWSMWKHKRLSNWAAKCWNEQKQMHCSKCSYYHSCLGVVLLYEDAIFLF